MNATDWIGYIAACLTTAAFVPQVAQSYRTRDVSGISLGMYLMFTLGIALWLLYGWPMRAWPVVVANVLTLGLAASILALKVQSVRRGDGT